MTSSSIESALKPFCNEAQVEAAPGVTLRLVMEFRTIDLLEGLLGRGMDELLGELSTSTGLMGKFIWAMTRKHHSDLSLDQIAGIMFTPGHGPALAATVGDLVKRSFDVGGDGAAEGEQGPRPPRRSAGASKTSSRNGSRPGSARATSGRKRRARSS